MGSEIVSAQAYVEALKQKYQGFDFPAYKLREWFSKTHQVFFECKEPDKEACLQATLRKTDLPAFTIFLWLKIKAASSNSWMLALGIWALKHWSTSFRASIRS
jgi:hypothetical protein